MIDGAALLQGKETFLYTAEFFYPLKNIYDLLLNFAANLVIWKE